MHNTKPANYSNVVRSTTNIEWDALILTAIGAILLLALVIGATLIPWLLPIRTLLGAAYILYIPGFFLSIVLFPHAESLDWIERTCLSFGLSIAAVPLLALLLDHLPWGIGLWSVLAAEYCLLLVSMMVAVARVVRLPPGMAYRPTIYWRPKKQWQWLAAQDKKVLLWGTALMCIAAVSMAWIFLAPMPAESMTEFSVLGKEGQAEDYPRQVAVDQPVSVTMVIGNQERSDLTYHAEIWVTDSWQSAKRTRVGAYGPIAVEMGKQAQVPISWAMPWAGNDQIADILLYRGDEQQPYRHLRLWINVQ